MTAWRAFLGRRGDQDGPALADRLAEARARSLEPGSIVFARRDGTEVLPWWRMSEAGVSYRRYVCGHAVAFRGPNPPETCERCRPPVALWETV